MANQIETKIEISYENRDRASVFFRWLLALPMAIFLGLFLQATHWGISSVVIVLPVMLAIVFRQAYPSWVLTFNHAILEFSMRIAAFMFFLTDKYPTLEPNQSVAVLLPDVEGGRKLNRWLPLVKWFLAIPLYVVGLFYLIYAAIAGMVLWLQISLTGKTSRWATEVVLNTLQYWNRIFGYAVLLVTDEYPTFTLK